MITRTLLICLFSASIVPTHIAGKPIDCKKIDQQKFKELFKFKFSGGQKGLSLDFGFGSKKDDYKFKVENCEFLLKDSKTKEASAKNYLKQAGRKSLGNLKACTKYDVSLTVQNLATKKDLSYQNVVHTKVDFKTTKLSLKVEKIENDSANLSWNLAGFDGSCITGYKVEVTKNDEKLFEKSVTDKKFVVKNLTACEIYTAKVTAETGQQEKIPSPEITFNLKTQVEVSKIEKLQLNIDKVTQDSAALSWTSDSEDCLQNYQLKLRDNENKIIYDKNVFTNSTVISNLTSCNNYSVELIALNSENLSLKAVIKSFITISTPINNITITVKQNHANVSWITPSNLELDCIVNYKLTYNILDCDRENCSASKIIGKTKTSADFSSLPLAKRFTLSFYANEITSGGEVARHAKTLPFNTIDYDKFVVGNINEFRLKRTELQLQWGVDLYVKKLVHFEVFFGDKVMTTNNTSIVLSVAACKANYSVVIRCVLADGFAGANVTYHTKLDDEDVPLSSLQNNIQFEQTKESVMISWAPIKEEEACISYYEITFNDQVFKTNKTRTEINDFAPCITYEIDITPISHHGHAGIQSTFEFTSEEFTPKTPTKLQLIEAGNKELKISTSISEDDKQCNSTAIEFTCNGITAVVNIELLNSEYVGKLTGLHPFTTYNCSAKVRNNVGVSESTEVAVFRTKQDAPQPPKNITSQVNSDNSVSVSWAADNSTGFAKNFKVFVTFENLIYETVAGCDAVRKKKLIEEVDESEIRLTNLEPHSQYSVKIESQSEYGISGPSKKLTIITNPADASPPRDISYTFSPHNDNETLVVGVLKWNPPCHINGRFDFYTVSLKGNREGFVDHSTTKGTSDNNITFSDLRRGFNYDFKVQAKTEKHKGNVEKISFKTPSGIPLEEDLKDWTLSAVDEETFDEGKGEIFIRRGTFFSGAGEVTGIAFLVFLGNCFPGDLPKPATGHISTTPQLPSTHNLQEPLECFKLYQQTEILPNPVLNSNKTNVNDYSIKFTIGSEICVDSEEAIKYCNGPLAAYTKYGMMARIITKNGFFRDTPPVYIQINVKPLELISAKTIVVSAFCSAIFVSLSILLCCVLSSKKKKRILKEKEAAESDENLLSFTSYCVIDKKPLPRKNY